MSFFAPIKKHAVIALAIALWIPTVGFGISKMLSYSTTPGHPAEPPSEWPRRAAIPRQSGKYSLVMFAHPQCQCTRASLGELAIIMAHSASRASARVLVYQPSQEPIEWSRAELWHAASAIPGVQVAEDRDAEIAASFGVYTSGQTLLYDPAGRLVFHGGITAFRGHSGDNAGRSTITGLLQGAIAAPKVPFTTRVFGCSLRGE